MLSSTNINKSTAMLRVLTVVALLLRAVVPNDHHHFSKSFEEVDGSLEIKSCLSPDLEKNEESTCRFYAMIFDAGSTGTRLHIFEFTHRYPTLECGNDKSANEFHSSSRSDDGGGSPFELVREVFNEEKPGLSFYATEPALAVDSVRALLTKAQHVVSRRLRPHTPLVLKATAGLRLLADEQAEAILQQVDALLSKSDYLVNNESVSMLSGTDEGIFGWFTLNFLLDRIDTVRMSPDEVVHIVNYLWTAGALDLGGGSTQITFRPVRADTLLVAPPHFAKSVNLFNQDVTLYTNSYLGNGLLAARLSLLEHATARNIDDEKSALPAHHNLSNACMPADFAMPWNYSGQIWMVHGTADYSPSACLALCRAYITASNIDAPPELDDRDLFAFGYFFDRGLQAGLVHDESGGTILVQHFWDAAQIACARASSDWGEEHYLPWQCLDLAYIYALLSDGYGLDDDKEITLVKKLRGMETSWALGAAYHLLNTYHAQRTKAAAALAGPVNLSQPKIANTSTTTFQRFTDQLYDSKTITNACKTVYEGVLSALSYFQLIA